MGCTLTLIGSNLLLFIITGLVGLATLLFMKKNMTHNGEKISAIILSFLAVVNIGFTTAFYLEKQDFRVIFQTITKENLLSNEEDLLRSTMNLNFDGEAKEFTLEFIKFEDIVTKNHTGTARVYINFILDSIKQPLLKLIILIILILF
ncbi:MAG: hypothetical protein KFW09_05695 [Oscillospiraceae bacterium]|nr:hypothetical protein [Oscillospiraceae bacterium]